MMVFVRNGPAKNLKGAPSEQSGFEIGARTAVSARSSLQIKFARTRLSALLFRRWLNPPNAQWISRVFSFPNRHIGCTNTASVFLIKIGHNHYSVSSNIAEGSGLD